MGNEELREKRTIYDVLMGLHTIPSTIEGNTPMERIKNAEKEINNIILNTRLEPKKVE